MESKLVYPAYYRIVRREGNTWTFSKNVPFYVPAHKQSANFDDIEEAYGTTRGKVAINLFRINGGKPGYYLANLRDKQYYYCGSAEQDIRTKLQELGIGRPDPLEG